MRQPLVSVIIPVYNGADYLSKAIDSAISQSYENIEIIVVNDGSCDGNKTEDISLGYGDKIRYIKKENGGVSSALNLGIKNMRGEFFSWLSHDDEYTEDKIQKEIEAALKYGEETLIYCGHLLIDKNSEPLKDVRKECGLKKNAVSESGEVLSVLLKEGTLNGCGFLIPKNVFERCGGFDETLRYNQDCFMWYKIFMDGFSLYYIPEECVLSRVHDRQLTQTGKEIFHRDCEAMSGYLIPRFSEISSKQNDFLLYYAENNAKYGNFSVAKDCVKEGKRNSLFSFADVFKIRAVCLYGRIRPFIRRVYFRLFRKIKTK